MSRLPRASVLAASLLLTPLTPLTPLSPLLAQEPAGREGSIRRELSVSRVEVDAYVTDADGEPIPDLTPADFRARLDGHAVEVESAEWVPAGRAEGLVPPATSEEAAGEASASSPVRYPPGRLLVLFFQTDYYSSRLVGLVRMANAAQTFIDQLLPTDRVAVVSYDSQLKLRQDFTSDRERIRAAVHRAIRMGPGEAPEPGAFPSLAARFDVVAARKATNVERGLTTLARALEDIGGAKALLLFGWGLGVNHSPKEATDYGTALRALSRARVSVFSLDVTDAAYHTLEAELDDVSHLTGGRYEKTHLFPRLALSLVSRSISGRYVLVLVKPGGARGHHELDVALVGRKGRVMTRSFLQD